MSRPWKLTAHAGICDEHEVSAVSQSQGMAEDAAGKTYGTDRSRPYPAQSFYICRGSVCLPRHECLRIHDSQSDHWVPRDAELAQWEPAQTTKCTAFRFRECVLRLFWHTTRNEVKACSPHQMGSCRCGRAATAKIQPHPCTAQSAPCMFKACSTCRAIVKMHEDSCDTVVLSPVAPHPQREALRDTDGARAQSYKMHLGRQDTAESAGCKQQYRCKLMRHRTADLRFATFGGTLKSDKASSGELSWSLRCCTHRLARKASGQSTTERKPLGFILHDQTEQMVITGKAHAAGARAQKCCRTP